MTRTLPALVAWLTYTAVVGASQCYTDGTVGSAPSKISTSEGGLTSFFAKDNMFGYAVAAAGDLNSDGTPDIFVGAIAGNDGASQSGSVYVLEMSSSFTVIGAQKISKTKGGLSSFMTLSTNDNFGSAIAAPGDLDNDGNPDMIVGMKGRISGADYSVGGVAILCLNSDYTVKSANVISRDEGSLSTFTTLVANHNFGSSLAFPGDIDGDSLPDLIVGAYGDRYAEESENIGAVFIITLNADFTVKGVSKISKLSGNMATFHTFTLNNMFGSALVWDDLNGDGSKELIVGARSQADGGPYTGAIWSLTLAEDLTVASASKISMTSGGLSTHYSFASYAGIGTSVAVAGDLNGDGTKDLFVGFSDGMVAVFNLNTDFTVAGVQVISDSEGGLSSYLTLGSSTKFGWQVDAPGDVNGDGVPDMFVGAYQDGVGVDSFVGGVYAIPLAQSTCYTNAPTPMPVTASPEEEGTCVHASSTVTVLEASSRNSPRGHQVLRVADIEVGQRLLAVDKYHREVFAEVVGLPHSKSKESFVKIVVSEMGSDSTAVAAAASGVRHELLATLHHTFPECFSDGAVQALDLKPGSCLHTTSGKGLIDSVELVAAGEGDETYTIELKDAEIVAVGGVFTHAKMRAHGDLTWEKKNNAHPHNAQKAALVKNAPAAVAQHSKELKSLAAAHTVAQATIQKRLRAGHASA